MKRSCLLSDLPPHMTAVIVRLNRSDALGRRLTDLGVTEGEQITAEFRSPFGDPTAYRVKGCLLALRKKDCGTVEVAYE